MALTRRQFVELAGSGLVYGFAFSCGGNPPAGAADKAVKTKEVPHAARYFVDYTEWIVIHSDGSVTAHTGRIELGQGLKTVLFDIITQGLGIPAERLELVMGDTDRCPDDGPTEGSSATSIVGWGYWHACDRVRRDLRRRAAAALDCDAERLDYSDGVFTVRGAPSRQVAIGELVDGTVSLETIDWRETRKSGPDYTDRRKPAVNAHAIVTGSLTYTGDLFPGECDYGAFLEPEYHIQLSHVAEADYDAAAETPGAVVARKHGRTAFAVAETYPAVQDTLAALRARWKVPGRPQAYDKEAEIRAGAKLARTMEDSGDPAAELAESDFTLTETYVTQYASQAPLETETAIARIAEDGGVTVWCSTQAPFKARPRVAEALGVAEDTVQIIAMPVGGGFGVKVDTPAPAEAAVLARASGRTVKLVYSRAHQFVNRARYKEAVVADITSGVSSSGKLVARTLDLYQDEGHGSTETYRIPNVLTRLFKSDVPPRHGTMRGTSFVQTCFAVESHTDMVARAIGVDPVEFRKRNLAAPAFAPLLDACAEMIGYGHHEPPEDHGIGFAICMHGGRQLGAVAAEVSVDRKTGVVRARRLVGAYDIGTLINRNTLVANVNGAMLWGLGFALFEEVKLDGHAAYTRSFDAYRIPRFSDVPPIELAFLDNDSKVQRPRGCGELPVVPTIGAIANAVYDAIGVRFYTLPLTPERVLEALAKKQSGSDQA